MHRKEQSCLCEAQIFPGVACMLIFSGWSFLVLVAEHFGTSFWERMKLGVRKDEPLKIKQKTFPPPS